MGINITENLSSIVNRLKKVMIRHDEVRHISFDCKRNFELMRCDFNSYICTELILETLFMIVLSVIIKLLSYGKKESIVLLYSFGYILVADLRHFLASGDTVQFTRKEPGYSEDILNSKAKHMTCRIYVVLNWVTSFISIFDIAVFLLHVLFDNQTLEFYLYLSAVNILSIIIVLITGAIIQHRCTIRIKRCNGITISTFSTGVTVELINGEKEELSLNEYSLFIEKKDNLYKINFYKVDDSGRTAGKGDFGYLVAKEGSILLNDRYRGLDPRLPKIVEISIGTNRISVSNIEEYV